MRDNDRAAHAEAELGERVIARATGWLDIQIPRLTWNEAQVREHQRDHLRALLAYASERSPFHARRLAGIDIDRFELADLRRLPTMSKTEMMASYDEVVTDRRLTRTAIETHLAASRERTSALFGEYVCLASGGSSGLRGVFAQTIDEYAQFGVATTRGPLALIKALGGPPTEGITIGMIAAASPIHSTGLAAAVAAADTTGPLRMVAAPATLPLAEIVERLNATQPVVLQGYPTALRALAQERRAGRLQLSPFSVATSSELLTTTDRTAITEGFGVPVAILFGSTEGLAGRSLPGEDVITFASDLCIVELVDADNRPVPDGVASAKILLTNLHNFTQPLIRYELTDRFIRYPNVDGSGHLRATVEGRADSIFRYGTIQVHPHPLRSALVGEARIREYQVHQTERGVDVDVVADGAIARDALIEHIEHALSAAGLPEPQVHVREVAAIPRHPDSGKVVRFRSLHPTT